MRCKKKHLFENLHGHLSAVHAPNTRPHAKDAVQWNISIVTEIAWHSQRMTFADLNPFEAINARIEASLGDERDSGRPRSPRPVRKCSIRARALLEAVSRAPGLVSEEESGMQRPPADLPTSADAVVSSGGLSASGLPAPEGSTSPPPGLLIESWVPKEGSRAGRLDIFRVPSIQQTP